MSFVEIYCEFLYVCTFPLFHVAMYYYKEKNIHAYVLIGLVLLTSVIHIFIMPFGFIIGIIVGLPFTIYKIVSW
jgi:hypothetical protein